MTEQVVGLSAASRRFPAIGWLLLSVAAMHGLMLVYDYLHPSVFFNADRALARWETIQGLYKAWDVGQFASYLGGHGIPGDYLFQGVLLALVGIYGLILAQVSLALFAGYCVYRMGRLLGMASGWATLASGVYLLLPHTLIFPHQLASEALYSPLLTISLWLTLASTAGKDPRALWLGAGLAGIATLIRPVTLLWPLLPIVVLLSLKRYRSAGGYAVAAYVLIVLWMAFMAGQTGSFGLGESDHDMAHNLYQRTARVVETLPPAEQADAKTQYLTSGAQGTLAVGEFLHFGLRYPVPFLLHSARDSVIFFVKSGFERIPIDYLLFNEEARASLQDSDSGWRKRLEKEGIGAALGYLWHTQGMVLVVSLVGSVFMLVLMALAIIGGWDLLRAREAKTRRLTAVLLVALPVYIFLFSQLVDAMQSRHRAPAEAGIVLLAVWGGMRLARRFSSDDVTYEREMR